MQTSKKKQGLRLIAAIVSFLLIMAVGSGILIRSHYAQFDKDYEVVFLGASQTKWGIDPMIVDEMTGYNSVNMATALCSFEGRYRLLEHMLDTQPVKLVVLDVACDALALDMENWTFEREVPVILQFTEFRAAMDYAKAHVASFSDIEMLYKNYMAEGMDNSMKLLLGKPTDFQRTKGYEGQTTLLMHGETEELGRGSYGSITTEYRSDSEEWLRKMVALCQERGVRVVIQTIPVSEKVIWLNTGWDVFQKEMASLTEEMGCEYYDFNLLKDRHSFLEENGSYNDLFHLSAQGAESYSQYLAEFLLETEAGVDVSDRFYETYDEVIDASWYAQQK